MPNFQLLNAMVMARQQMTRCIDRFDVLPYKSQDQGSAERGLDQLILDTMSALQRVYEVRNSLDAGVP